MVCRNCSSKKTELEYLQFQSARVCEECYSTITSNYIICLLISLRNEYILKYFYKKDLRLTGFSKDTSDQPTTEEEKGIKQQVSFPSTDHLPVKLIQTTEIVKAVT